VAIVHSTKLQDSLLLIIGKFELRWRSSLHAVGRPEASIDGMEVCCPTRELGLFTPALEAAARIVWRHLGNQIGSEKK
jgi:hypothetical protein